MATEAHVMHLSPEREHEIRTTAKVVTGGSVGEFIGGGAGLVLAILGLAGIYPAYTGPIAAICIGGALVLEGGAMGARFRRLLSEATQGPVSSAELGGGVGAEFLGGSAGVVLGILSLMHVETPILLAVTAIVLGGAVLISAGAVARMNALSIRPEAHGLVRVIARDAVFASAGGDVLVGGGAIVLGILALVGLAPTILILVAFLSIGASVLLSALSVSGHLWEVLTE